MPAESVGESKLRILFRHVIPNGIFPIIANTTMGVASAILLTAANVFVFLAYGTTATVARHLGAGSRPNAVAAGIDTASAAAARELSAAGALIARSAEDIRSLSESAAADVTTAADRLTTAARDLDGVLSRSVSDSMALLDESIARLNDSMGGMNAAADNVTRSLQSLPRTASAMDGDVKAVSKAIDAELKVLLKAVSDTQKSLNKFTAELDRRTDVG